MFMDIYNNEGINVKLEGKTKTNINNYMNQNHTIKFKIQ